jgi:hypothetical protein
LAIVLHAAVTSADAHRVDEYLQATTILLEKDRIQIDIRLVPGVQVVREVLAILDTDKNDVIADVEVRAYAHRLQRDLSLALDAKPLRLRLISAGTEDIETLKAGVGEIRLRFVADVQPAGGQRRLVFENRHQGTIASYLVNTLVPVDPDIRITAQNRNPQQSWYQLEYTLVDRPTAASAGR